MIWKNLLIRNASFSTPQSYQVLDITRIILQIPIEEAFDSERKSDLLLLKVDDFFRVINVQLCISGEVRIITAE